MFTARYELDLKKQFKLNSFFAVSCLRNLLNCYNKDSNYLGWHRVDSYRRFSGTWCPLFMAIQWTFWFAQNKAFHTLTGYRKLQRIQNNFRCQRSPTSRVRKQETTVILNWNLNATYRRRPETRNTTKVLGREALLKSSINYVPLTQFRTNNYWGTLKLSFQFQ
jgi:hypothetical protein